MNLRVTFVWLLSCFLAVLTQSLSAQVITSFAPAAGAPGDQIRVLGSGFSSGNFFVFFWNGVPASGRIDSDTQLTLVVPGGITTGPIGIQPGGIGQTNYTVDDFLAVGNGPYISSFLPQFGSVNDQVTISGVHLANPTLVKFGGIRATQFAANADGTQITTRVPAGATNAPITVSTTLGTSNTLNSFSVIALGPFVTGFAPVSGGTSTKVQISGVHFTGVTNVSFAGTAGVALSANSDVFIQVQPPAGVITGPLTVYAPSGSFTTTSNFFGSPAITGFSPLSGRAGTNVVINGTNLLGASKVFFGSVASPSFTVQSNFKLTTQVPVGVATGLIRVVVPAGSAFSPSNFVVAPTISGFSPTFGAVGATVTISGVNLNASTPTVKFNGVLAAAPSSATSTQVVVHVPAGATTGPLSLSTVDGVNTTTTLFYLPPTITSLSSTNAQPGSRIGLTGQNFLGANAVSFNGAAATGLLVTNNTSVSVLVPSDAVSGPVSITTPGGTGVSPQAFYARPIITQFSPNFGLPGSNVTVQGVNFLQSSVKISGLAASLVSQNNTQLVATVPAGATTGPITVTSPAGSASSTNSFIVAYTSDLFVSVTNSAASVPMTSNLVFTIGIYNKGPFAAPNATFTNILPTGAVLAGVSFPPQWTLSTNGNNLSGTVGNLANGASANILVTVRPQTAGQISSSVVVASDNVDPHLIDNSAFSIATVQPLALLSIGAIGSGVNISWPVAFTNYVLEYRDQLGAASGWSVVTNTTTISGELEFVVEPTNGIGRLYRLRR